MIAGYVVITFKQIVVYRNGEFKHDLYNWEQGFRRLTLGSFLQSDYLDIRSTYSIGNFSYVPMDVEFSQQSEAAWFMLIVRSLIADTSPYS